MRIRTAQVNDAPAIAAVYVDTWRVAYAGILSTRFLVNLSQKDIAAGWRSTIRRSGRRQIVLVTEADDHTVFGFGSAGPNARRALGFDSEVHTLYVDFDHQDDGAGRALLAALFARLVQSGARSAFLWALAANPSRFFYEAMGGRAAARRTEWIAGKAVPQIAYGWPDLEGAIEHLGSRNRTAS